MTRCAVAVTLNEIQLTQSIAWVPKVDCHSIQVLSISQKQRPIMKTNIVQVYFTKCLNKYLQEAKHNLSRSFGVLSRQFFFFYFLQQE